MKTVTKKDREVIKRNIGMYGLGGLFFVAFGIMFLLFHLSIYQQETLYSDGSICPKEEKICEIPIIITKELDSTVYVYYQVRQLWINNWGFINSKNIEQLQGKDLPVSRLRDCHPYVTNEDLGVNKSINGSRLDPKGPANPCGLAAALYFNGLSFYSKNRHF